MKYFVMSSSLFLIGILAVFSSSANELNAGSEFLKPSFLDTVGECQPEVVMNRAILEEFLTSSTAYNIRVATGTNGLLTSQIQLVPDTASACTFFLSDYEDSLNETVADTLERQYSITFYKVSNFYFVVTTHKKSENPNRKVFGLSFLDIFDNSLNYIDGFAF